jgi:hypothetical protein
VDEGEERRSGDEPAPVEALGDGDPAEDRPLAKGPDRLAGGERRRTVGGAGPQTDAQLTRSLPGTLNFVVRWQGNADVDIFVANDPRSIEQIIAGGFSTFNPDSILYPGFGLQTSPSGGRIAAPVISVQEATSRDA